MFNAKVVKDFISRDEAAKIIEAATAIDPWDSSGTNSYWDNRNLNAVNIYNIHNPELGKLLYDIRIRVGESIKNLYSLDQEIYPDLFQVVRWYDGQEMGVHADDMTNVDSDDLDWFEHRHYGAVIYLNDDYSGGNTYYPEHGVEIKPEVGTLAIHPGDPEHAHGVSKIVGNTRYTLASFWTLDKEYFDGWTI
jgi:hypothetical protein